MKILDNVIVSIVCFFLLLTLLTVLCFAQATSCTRQQITAHDIAELARALDLEETNPIIVEAKRLWNEDDVKIVIDDNKFEIIGGANYEFSR